MYSRIMIVVTKMRIAIWRRYCKVSLFGKLVFIEYVSLFSEDCFLFSVPFYSGFYLAFSLPGI